MNNKPVLFIDSGIGGIPYCMDFLKKNPQEAVCYLADHENYPYGPREKEELTEILNILLEKYFTKIEPKIAVLACNTATIAALSSLRKNFSQIPFVGTVPAIKPAANVSSNGKVGVLGTARTIEEVNSLNLTDKSCEIFGIAAPELVDFIELHFDDSEKEKNTEIVKKYVDLFRAENVDTLVLGCTHFLFLLEEFRREAAPYFEVFDSLAGITKRIEYLLDENSNFLRAERDSVPVHKLFVTGKKASGSFWKRRAHSMGFSLVMSDEL
jgi:glutamate racemase